MKKLLKIVAALTAVFIVLITGLVFVFSFSIDSAAKTVIEEGGTYALGVETTLDSADVQILKGAFSMKGLTVANPEGFDAEFVTLGNGHVEVDYESLQSDVVELPLLTISDLNMTLYKNKDGANYKIILENLKKLQSDNEGEVDPPSGDEKKMVIRKLLIENIKVDLELLPLGGNLAKANIPIERIELQNVGSGGDPIDVGQLIAIVIKSTLKAVAENAGNLPGDFANMLGDLSIDLDQLGAIGEEGAKILVDAGEGLKDIGGDLSEEAKKATEGLEDLGKDLSDNVKDVFKNPFGNKDKDEKDGG